jgi:antitoxin component YwqK of YwqJK toxin-antitoxin module
MKFSTRYRWLFSVILIVVAAQQLAALQSLRAQDSADRQQDSATIQPYTGPAIFLDEPEETVKAQLVRRDTMREPEEGQVRIERQIAYFSDGHFEADGFYREYYPNGKLFVEGQYAGGRQNGEWTYYFDNSQINRKAVYKNGKLDGAREVYRADGTLSAKRGFADGLRDGEWITYDETGKKPLVEGRYVKGKEDGTWKYWWPNGELQRQLEVKLGEREGKMTEWDEKGEKRFEATFVKNKLHGTATRWFPDGRKIVQQYEDGRLVSQSS